MVTLKEVGKVLLLPITIPIVAVALVTMVIIALFYEVLIKRGWFILVDAGEMFYDIIKTDLLRLDGRKDDE